MKLLSQAQVGVIVLEVWLLLLNCKVILTTVGSIDDKICISNAKRCVKTLPSHKYFVTVLFLLSTRYSHLETHRFQNV